MSQGQVDLPGPHTEGDRYETSVRRGDPVRRRPVVCCAGRAGADRAAAPGRAHPRRRARAIRQAECRSGAAQVRAAGAAHPQRHRYHQPQRLHLRRSAGSQRRGGLVGLHRHRLRHRLRFHERERSRRSDRRACGYEQQRRDRGLPRQHHRLRDVRPLQHELGRHGARRGPAARSPAVHAGQGRQRMVPVVVGAGPPVGSERRWRDTHGAHRHPPGWVDHHRVRAHHLHGPRVARRRLCLLLGRRRHGASGRRHPGLLRGAGEPDPDPPSEPTRSVSGWTTGGRASPAPPRGSS